MSSVGLSEWVLLALIGLIVLGPERLPKIANQIGNWIGQARRMTRVMKRQLEDEINLEKANNINPAANTPAAQQPEPAAAVEDAPPHIPANEDDDSFSPEHDAEGIGTGVGDDDGFEVDDLEPAEQQREADATAGDPKEQKP